MPRRQLDCSILCSFLTPALCAAALSPARAQERSADSDFAPAALGERIEHRRDIAYAGTENPRQTLDLLLPTERARAVALPVIVFIHGGAWRSGDKRAGVLPLAPFVVSGRFAGATVGYRLSDEAIWPAQIHDVKAALRWLRAHARELGVDADRIAVWGPSAGGHLAAMIGVSGEVAELEGGLGSHAEVSSRVRCVVDWFGPSELLAMNAVPGRMDHDAPDSPESRLLGAPLQESRERARTASPITFVTGDDAPVLLVHGADDPLVPYDQSVRLHAALAKANVPASLVRVAGAGHGGFGGTAVSLAVLTFLEKHLLDRPVEIPAGPLEVAARDNLLTPSERERGWVLLFDGESLDGWMTSARQPSRRAPEGGALNPYRSGDYMLVHETPRGDFLLSLDFRIAPGTNSGVFFRTRPLEPRPGKDVGYNGLEVAIDDTTTAGYHDTGALYDLVAPARNAMRVAGEWNHLELRCAGPLVEVALNGEVVTKTDLESWTEPGKRPDGSTHKFSDTAYRDHPQSGYLGLQDHGGECWFQNIKLLPLGPAAR